MAAGALRKKVNILAMGSSRTDFDSLQMIEQRPDILVDAELWGINYMGAVKRLDRVIHVDPVHAYLGHGPVKDMCDLALKDGIPFYTSWPHPMYSNHVVYPFDKIVQALGIHYINGTVAAAVAMAIFEGFTDIGLFGCDFSYPNAHLSEAGRANVEFLVGMGTQRGIRFAIASTSTLLDMYCQQQPYGFFKNPLLPPNNGGSLMNVQEIIAHCAEMRNPTKVAKPIVYAIHPRGPEVVVPVQAITAEHKVAVNAPDWSKEPAIQAPTPHLSLAAVNGAAPPKPNGADNAPDNVLLPN